MKYCNKCKEEKPKSEFNKRRSMKDGLQPQCRSCQKLYFNSYYEKNGEKVRKDTYKRVRQYRQLFLKYKQTLSCERCDESHWACLDFHHHNDDKEDVVSTLQYSGPTKAIEEAKKCTVLCSNCHRKEHAKNLYCG